MFELQPTVEFGGLTSTEVNISTTLHSDSIVSEAIDFKKLTISYMNNEARSYGYPDIFAAMSLKNSSIPELVAEGASWTEFFDAGMTYIDYKIKSEEYIGVEKSILTIKGDTTSPKVTFTPSLTYPSLQV